MKSYFMQIYKIIFLLLITNSSNLYAHNLFNGGCKEHCGQKVKVISNKNKLKNIKFFLFYFCSAIFRKLLINL